MLLGEIASTIRFTERRYRTHFPPSAYRAPIHRPIKAFPKKKHVYGDVQLNNLDPAGQLDPGVHLLSSPALSVQGAVDRRHRK